MGKVTLQESGILLELIPLRIFHDSKPMGGSQVLPGIILGGFNRPLQEKKCKKGYDTDLAPLGQ